MKIRENSFIVAAFCEFEIFKEYEWVIKVGSKSEGPKNVLAAPFLNPFSELPAVKKDSKNGGARKFEVI